MKDCMERIETDHKLMNVAVLNAIGKSFAKNYKYIDLFKSQSTSNKTVSDEERAELKTYFESW